jgi:hypothetical protein
MFTSTIFGKQSFKPTFLHLIFALSYLFKVHLNLGWQSNGVQLLVFGSLVVVDHETFNFHQIWCLTSIFYPIVSSKLLLRLRLVRVRIVFHSA